VFNKIRILFVVLLCVSSLGATKSCHKSKPVRTPPSTVGLADNLTRSELADNLKASVYSQVAESNFTEQARVALNRTIENGAVRVADEGMTPQKITLAKENARKLGEVLKERFDQMPTGLEGRKEIDLPTLQSLRSFFCPLYPFC
jgi:hypothetical protein